MSEHEQPDTPQGPGGTPEHGNALTPGAGPAGGGQPTYGPPPSHPYGTPQPYGQQPSYEQQSPYGQHAAPGQPGAPWYAGPTQPGTSWSPQQTAVLPPPAEQQRPRRGGLRLAAAGVVVGALVGGGVGAGVVAATDGGSGSTASGSTQSVVIKDPQSATTATAAAAKAAPSVVTIYVNNDQEAGSGSGVVLTGDGYVLTNDHVVTLEGTGTGTVQVRAANGTMYDATVVGTDESDDLAVVKLTGARGLTPATFADSGKVQVGDAAVAIGAPLGLSNTVTTGIVSAVGRAVETGQSQNATTVIDAIQTDAAINPGNSGGALVNGAGQVIGINSAIASVADSSSQGQSAQSGNIGVGFAIPSNVAKRVADQIMSSGKATHPVLGVSVRTATSGTNAEAGLGAQVVQVQGGSPAAKAGLQAGDVVTAVGDQQVQTDTDLTADIRSATPGSTVQLSVTRGNATRKVSVQLTQTGS